MSNTSKDKSVKKLEDEGEKAKVAQKPKVKEPKFPIEAFVNPLGFIYLSKEILSTFGVAKGQKTPITVDIQDNSLIIRKV